MKDMTDDERYKLLGQLLASVPDLTVEQGSGALSQTTQMWLGRADALINAGGDLAEIIRFRSEHNSLPSAIGNAAKLLAPVYRAFAQAELKASPAIAGSFIPVGNAFDALTSIAKVFSGSKKDLFIIDPYLDEKVLTDFALLAPEGTALRLLTTAQALNTALPPAITAWRKQHEKRPLELRVTPTKGTLHDRLVIVDTASAWTLTQSFNAFAKRSPASIILSDPEISKVKFEAYQELWDASEAVDV